MSNNERVLAATPVITMTDDTTARFTLQNGQPVKYITLSKGQHFAATKSDGSWSIKVGSGMVTVEDRLVTPSKKKISFASLKNKIELNTNTFAPIYAAHAKKGKPIATIAKNMRISSNGLKGQFYEVVIGGRTGYIHCNDVSADTGVPVLIYHHFVKNQANSVYKDSSSVYDIDLFDQQMNYLQKNGFSTITLKDLDLWMQRKQALPSKAVVLTFDDANLSVEKLVYPILKRNNMVATTFIIGDRVTNNTPEFNMETVQFAGYAELAGITDIFDLEYHTYGLHVFNSLTGKSGLQYASANALKYDFINAKEVLLKADPTAVPSYFAYPYGKYIKANEAVLIQSGISLAFLNKGGKAEISSPRLYIPRIPVQGHMTVKQFAKAIRN
ncbi:polysaccharide deacetylase family protein [Solibacillus sp. FSL H8-0538]|uniref:polysaccharide deacetylase family protein n=1 Tax=Solibacillus sp. FSL H8-0538 TaxID=2921400 RepID=UPI0030F7198A